MIKLLLDKTDEFLFNSVKNIFKKIEKKYEFQDLSIDIEQELKNFESSPLACVIACDTEFEKSIKIQLKIILGIFFVVVPFVGFSSIACMFSIEHSYVFILTFIIAMLATSRLDEIATRYVNFREKKTKSQS